MGLNLIDNYGDKTSSDTIILYNKTGINLLGLNPPNPITSKIIFPMLNGSINQLTISSDHLAISQYINGHKTATIAELSIASSTRVKFQSRNWEKEWFFYSIAPHPDNPKNAHHKFPDIDDDSNPSRRYYNNILPDVISLFHCTDEEFLKIFDFVV